MTTDREAPQVLDRFESGLQASLGWISEHPREVLTALGLFLGLGAAIAGGYEWRQRQDARAHDALASVEREFSQSMAGDPSIAIPSEPANPEQARAAREQALEGFAKVVVDHGGLRAAEMALLRAAEMEIDLGRADAAIARLQGLAAALAADDPLRAIALRLQGYAFETLGRAQEAADAYVAAAAVAEYPDRGVLWIMAGDTFTRIGAREPALAAFNQALAADPVFAEQQRVVNRIEELERAAAGTPAQ